LQRFGCGFDELNPSLRPGAIDHKHRPIMEFIQSALVSSLIVLLGEGIYSYDAATIVKKS
jgi:hypothetical protein